MRVFRKKKKRKNHSYMARSGGGGEKKERNTVIPRPGIIIGDSFPSPFPLPFPQLVRAKVGTNVSRLGLIRSIGKIRATPVYVCACVYWRAWKNPFSILTRNS